MAPKGLQGFQHVAAGISGVRRFRIQGCRVLHARWPGVHAVLASDEAEPPRDPGPRGTELGSRSRCPTSESDFGFPGFGSRSSDPGVRIPNPGPS